MKVKFLGDVHGNRKYISDFEPNTIQIGDFDLVGYDWWGMNFSTKKEWCDAYGLDIEDFISTKKNSNIQPVGKRFFIDGNHDYFPALDTDASEPYEIRPNLVYIPRGYVNGKVLFIGGADSIDKKFRTSYYDWFPEESFTRQQVDRILDINKEIEVVVSHDCPVVAAEEILKKYNGLKFNFASSVFLQEVYMKFKPKLWVFGHWHRSLKFQIENTVFCCCNELEKKEFFVPLEQDFFSRNWDKKYSVDKR